jgi:hypothetical protein
MGQKTSDLSAIPLCTGHHREDTDSYHRLGESLFIHVQKLNLPEIVSDLNSRFRQIALDQSHHPYN